MMFIVFILIFIAAVLIIALILPSRYEVKKSTTITSDISKCFNMIADLNNYRDWNPWAKMEPTANTKISGDPKTVGHQYTWEGKRIGVGGLTIIDISENKSVSLELMFIKPFSSKASDNWTFEALPNNQVKITWTNSGELPFPTARLMGPMIKKNLEKQFEEGLNNIKTMCEN